MLWRTSPEEPLAGGGRLPDVPGIWGTDEVAVESGIELAGSPGRSVVRACLREHGGRLFVLEGIAPRRALSRQAQSAALEELSASGLSAVKPWMRTLDGEPWHRGHGLFWQLREYVEGLPLDRATYGLDSWRGTAASRFLADMRQARTGVAGPVFRHGDYIGRLLPWIRRQNERLSQDIKPVADALDVFLTQAEPQLPPAFCHGDFHPGNIIWGEASIQGVIDWEFCGQKTEMTDAANLLGCIGMDNPDWLRQGFAAAFLAGLRDAGLFEEASWRWLPELTVAVRFGWLREWCCQRNIPMMVQELDFMGLLLDHRDWLAP